MYNTELTLSRHYTCTLVPLINSLQTNLFVSHQKTQKDLGIHANISGSHLPTDPKLGSVSHNRLPLPGHSWLLRNWASGGEKWKLPCCFLVNIRKKGHAYILEPPTQELGTFSAKKPPKCR